MENNSDASHETAEQRLKQFECKICLEIATEPVVTLCGHLFCWPCIYKWGTHKELKNVPCPTCKGEIDVLKLIPLYTSAEAHNMRTKNLPNRPQGARNPEPEARNQGFWGNLFGNQNNQDGQGMNFMFMGFPGFGFQFNMGGNNAQAGVQRWFAMGFMFVMMFFSFFASLLPSIFGVTQEYDYSSSSRQSYQSGSRQSYQRQRTQHSSHRTYNSRSARPSSDSSSLTGDELMWYGYALLVTGFLLYTVARIFKTTPTANRRN